MPLFAAFQALGKKENREVNWMVGIRGNTNKSTFPLGRKCEKPDLQSSKQFSPVWGTAESKDSGGHTGSTGSAHSRLWEP